jgi:hypothetical protein
VGFEIPSAELKFQSSVSNQEVKFIPSLRGLLNVGVTDARYFGISAGLPLEKDEKDRRKEGKSKYNDFRFNFAFTRFFLQVGYVQYRGFYIENSRDADPTWHNGLPYLRESDLYKRTFYANATMIVKPQRYSLESAVGQTAHQIISGGSWLWGLAAREEKIDNPDAIIPLNIRTGFGRDQNMQSANMTSAFIKGGYGYQFNFTPAFFINAYATLGVGMKQLSIRSPGENHKETESATKIDAQLSIVNNGKKFYGGFRTFIDSATYDSRDMKIDSNFYSFAIFAGRRFH